ncbi:MAG: SAM-dependent methyltransferase, partial [Bacillota bacterium]|nr:SAM-dependent methyltransferase [Bacillota bacterium]
IKNSGPIIFQRFMELALYHPQWGYYTSAREKIGGAGDFYTSSHVGSIFGEMMGRQLLEIWERLERPSPFNVVEYGAGKGLWARDIIMYLENTNLEAYGALNYAIIEISPNLQKHQQETLLAAGISLRQVRWVENIKEVAKEPFIGCIISNELIDAFPVHMVQNTDKGMMEAMVNLDEQDNLIQEFSIPASNKLLKFAEIAQLQLEEGQIIEINLAGVKWLEEVSQALQKGYILTIDYGYLSQELVVPHRFDGTLLCYERHQVKENPLENIGARDITAHVNFTSLMEYGKLFGLENLGYTTQGKFLLAIGILERLEEEGQKEFDLERFKRQQQIKQLIMPGGMGDTFKLLAQGKNLSLEEQQLTGVKKLGLR